MRRRDERSGLGIRVERAAQADALRAVDHRVDELVVQAVLDDEPRAGRTDLARVEEHRRERVVDRGLEVRVGEDDVRVLAAEFQRDALDRAGGGGHDVASGDQAAGERDQVDIGVLRERSTDLRSGPEHEVGDAGGHARLRQRPHEHDRGGRGQLARLEHEGVARGQRGSDLPRRLQQRIVPRRDQPAHADGLPHHAADRVVPAGVDDPPGVGAGHPAEVAEAGDDVIDVVLGLDQSLAGVQRLGPRHLRLVPLEEVGHAEQQRAPLPGRQCGPGAVVEGGPRGRDRRRRVGGARLVHGGDRAPVRGAGDVAAPARGGRHPSPGDEQIRHGTSRSALPCACC